MPISKSLNQVLKALTPVGRGDSVYQVASADRINNIQDAIRLLVRGDNIVGGVNIRKRSADGYVLLTGQPGGAKAFAAAGGFPWEISVGVDDTGTFVTLSPGTINNIIPSNMFDKIYIGPTDTWYIVLHCLTDGDTITGVSLAGNNIPPDPIGSSTVVAPDTLDVLLGVVVDGTPYQIIDSLITVNPQLTIWSLADPLVPGAPYYEPNFTWAIIEL